MWVKAQNNAVVAYPYTIEQLRADHPNVSIPRSPTADALAEFGVFAVVHADTPTYDPIMQRVDTSLAPVLIAGAWTLTKTVVALSPEQVAANQAEAAARLQKSIIDATQNRLDSFARTRKYDGILSLCTYATSAVPKFQAEGQYGVTARDATWAKLYQMLDEVQAGTRPMPSGYADIEGELPVLQWPA